MTDETKRSRFEAAVKELVEAAAEYMGSPMTQYLLVTGHENRRTVASHAGCDCPVCRMRLMVAAGNEMGGRMQAVRLPDEPNESAVDAAGLVH